MTNILEAVYNIISAPTERLNSNSQSRNRANSMGESLENYIKNAFAGTFGVVDENQKLEIYNEKFSWLGTQNNPPDIMIMGGDAIEVKKTQSALSGLALNSSYPKDFLYSDSPMITKGCRECESWKIKDLIYCVGHTNDTTLKSLWMVYGNIYAASGETYTRIKSSISNGIETIPDIVFSETREFGRVNQVDPLGITNLRIRGMWHIENPRKVFNYIHKTNKERFELVCIIPKDKFDSFPESSISKILSLDIDGFKVYNTKVKDPNNPAKLIDCTCIKYIR